MSDELLDKIRTRRKDEAIARALRALEQTESPEVELILGRLYEAGEAVPKSMEEAVRLYREGASHGSAECMLRLAMLYEHGDAVPKDMD